MSTDNDYVTMDIIMATAKLVPRPKLQKRRCNKEKSECRTNRNSNRKEINIAKMKRIGLVCQRVLAPSDRVTANPVRERVIVQNRNT